MACVRSLGLHVPSALPFLIAENLLPADPTDEQYAWVTCVDESPAGAVADEIVWTKECVVWSRAGLVTRVFRLDLEKEEIRHALITHFAPEKIKRSNLDASSSVVPGRLPGKKQDKQRGTESKLAAGLTLGGESQGHGASSTSTNGLSRALVVVLKSQAHIFFLSGNSHVVPLPFEVDSVFATPRGLLFQRKVHDEDKDPPVIYPMAPPNSFASRPVTGSQSMETSMGKKTARPSLTVSPAQGPELKPKSSKQANLPRVFSLMDPHSEMGLVVTTSQSSRWLQSGAASNGSRPSGLDVLDPADEIVYVSPTNELSESTSMLLKGPLILVVTVNTHTGLYTIWTARYRDEESEATPNKKRDRRETGGTRSRRRSSHIGMATGATTPVARASTTRESFGPRGDNWNVSGISTEGKPDDEDLASRLGQDFGDIGVPSKTSRRVSSLLARTDLATNQDRITFSDLATGSQSSSVPHAGPRQSIGGGGSGVNTRASFGFNPRGSLPPGNASVYSTTSSVADGPVDRLLEELNNDTLYEGFENLDLKESTSGLPEEVLLSKVESFPMKFSSNFQKGDKSKSSSRRLKISTLTPSACSHSQNGHAALALCIVDQNAKSMAIVNLRADRLAVSKKDRMMSKKSKRNGTSEDRSLLVQATGVHHYSNILDASRLVDGEISRLAILSATEDGRHEITLQSPWCNPMAVDIPKKLMLYDPYGVSTNTTTNRPRESGLHRLMTDSSLTVTGLDHASAHGRIDVVDDSQRKHSLQVQMQPSNEVVKNIIRVCRFALRDTEKAGEGILVAWWEVMKWLRGREANENDLEWTAMVIVLFSMAIPFIENEQAQTPVKQRRKRGLPRSSSGSYVDLECWEAMLDQESGSAGVVAPWMNNNAWGWIVEQDAEEEASNSNKSSSSSRRGKRSSTSTSTDLLNASRTTFRKNSYLLRCAALTREFLQSPQGTDASGPEGYLPTAETYNVNSRRTALCTVLVGLHVLREEQKLSICETEQSRRALGLLAPVLAQLGRYLGWKSWTWAEDAYFGCEIASMDRWQFEDKEISLLDVPPEPFEPPSIFAFAESAWRQPTTPFLSLLDLISATDRAPRKGKLWQECFTLTPRTLALNGFLSEIHRCSTSLDKIKLLHRWGLRRNIIETFPEGVSAPLYEAIMQSQVRASTSWNAGLLELIDREDLNMSMNTDNSRPFSTAPQPAVLHDSLRDVHHIGTSALDIDAINSFEASAEADRFSVTRLIFREDKRFVEAARLLNQSKPPAAECTSEPEWTDSDLLEAQKEVVQLVTLRTLSIPAGRAMLAFSGRLPLLTEKLPIPSFSLQCVMKPSNVTVSADRAAFSEEKVCWAFFHNGVSTGLAISKASKGIDTSWILFNKPHDLTNRHAGFLLALGLNGHLRSLAKWVAFKYLTPKHTMTSIGLLLGLSASYLGTMDTLITRLLSVHVTRMLPMGAAELNLSPLTQTAGILGIGLLYCNSQHRRMSEVMLSEIENAEQEDGGSSAAHEDLRDEGYRLAAGFALGFINLGKGKDLRGMRDMQIVERLLAIAVGTKNVDLAHVLDRATAGATMALAIIFMKTNDGFLAQKIDIPDTSVRFDYVRPDLFLLRTLARHLIMWDSIQASEAWIVKSLPKIYRRRYRLTGVRRLKSDDMPFVNIIAGLCFTLGLRYAGTATPHVRDLLLSYLDQFMRICRLPAVNYDGKLTRNSIRHCQDIVALSAATVMAGTGDLALFRRLRSLHGRVDGDTPYGSHMAAHMAIGMLFLGGGSHTLGMSDLAIASLLCALYPIFPNSVLDNKCHLQAFRHLWVLAAEPRCLIPRDIDTRRPISIPITISGSGTSSGTSSDSQTLTAPCLLPDLAGVHKIEVRSADYWPVMLDFGPHRDGSLREKFRQGDQSVYLRRKNTYNPTGSSVFVSTFSGLATTNTNVSTGPFPTTAPANTNANQMITPELQTKPGNQNMWDWVFQLRSLHGLDIRDRSLVLPSSFPTTSTTPWLRVSSVDSKLVLERNVLDMVQVQGTATDTGTAIVSRGTGPDEVRDRLWQLRLLFGWVDGQEDESDGEEGRRRNGLWLRREFIEAVRWRIWQYSL